MAQRVVLLAVRWLPICLDLLNRVIGLLLHIANEGTHLILNPSILTFQQSDVFTVGFLVLGLGKFPSRSHVYFDCLELLPNVGGFM